MVNVTELLVPFCVVTVTPPLLAPEGTFTINWVVPADEGVAVTDPPNVTVLDDAVELKLVPAIVMVDSVGPELGLMEVIVGADWAKANPVQANSPTKTIKNILLVLQSAPLIKFPFS